MYHVLWKKLREGRLRRMKIELTQRDKKLLTFLAVFVIVVLVGYYGVLPQLKEAQERKDEIEEQEAIRDVNDQKIVQLIFVEDNNNELEKLIAGAKENYYPMMDADAIDNLITNKVIDEYRLMAYDLNIGERELASLDPYVYSEKAITGESYARQKAQETAAASINDDGTTLFTEVVEADSATVGIYTVTVSMKLGGEMKNMERLMDDLAYSDNKLRLVEYSIDTVETIIPHDDGTEEIYSSDTLNLTVELYMCQE